ncbi:ABC transporter permease [Microbacterium sp. p3-SID336]|uniref:ABC transporter permease n=1 Tax=Microbacterium sp. p3-SID336 TaxID=2916212 RepID=UPI0021A2AF61|nr:ABC transporter permease [Microbacterium sp. p3-SID336]MCT1477713.1 ABC transporter permease [Microbacterium sp. p3-SID336]
MNALRTLVSPRGAVFLLLVVLLVAVTVLNPSFADPGQFMRFLQRVAPIAIVAIGQYFVIIAGEFDLSQGSLITAQVIIAGNLVGQDDSRTIPVLLLMVVFAVAVGLVNGVLTTLLKVPSFIVTLGMMLALLGGVMWWTGGAATGNPADSFREIGRGGFRDVPLLEFIPWAVLLLIAWLALGIWVTKRPLGKTLIAVGDNARAVDYAGARRAWVTTRAFVISSLSATLSAVLLVGYAGVHPSVGRGYEFTAITAVVLGGVVLGGGRGWIVGAVAGAFTLEALFMLLNIAGVPSTLRDAVQGVIIIAAVAYSAVAFRARRRRAPQVAQTPADPADARTPTGAAAAQTSTIHTETRGD